MNEKEIKQFLVANIEPVADVYSRRAYRAAVYLRDGTYLPCVVFRKASDIVELALRRFDETRSQKLDRSMGYRSVVEVFVTGGNRLAVYDVDRVTTSPFALPTRFRDQLWSAGETAMGWISFTATMDDEQEFWFGTSFNIDFFEMPSGYTADRITAIHPHNALQGVYLRDKPFFDCCIGSL